MKQKVKTETKKHADAIKTGEEAEESIPELESNIQVCTEKKAEEDEKLEAIFEDMKGVTDKLRGELEEKTQELAPVKQERAVFQAALDTAETEVKLLEDATTRAKEKLAAAESELASLDSTQAKKREELAACEDELTESKERIVDAEKEEKELSQKEVSLAKRNKELMVRRIVCECIAYVRFRSLTLFTSLFLRYRLVLKNPRLLYKQRVVHSLRLLLESSRPPKREASSPRSVFLDALVTLPLFRKSTTLLFRLRVVCLTILSSIRLLEHSDASNFFANMDLDVQTLSRWTK